MRAPVPVPLLDPWADVGEGILEELLDADRWARRRWSEAFPLRAAIRVYGQTIPGDPGDELDLEGEL